MTRVAAAILSVATASVATAQADRPFLNPAWEVGERPGEIVTADFNGDGWLDAAVLNEWGASVSVLLNDGAGGLEPKRTYGLGAEVARAMAAGDLDGDGDIDIFTASWGPSTRLLLNRGDGTFESRSGPAAAGDAEHAALGDLNGDGALDAVLTLGWDETVQVIFGAGDSAAESVMLDVGKRAERVRLADLDQDGSLDIVVMRWTAQHDSISVFLNRGDGSFGPRRDYQGGFSAQDVAIGDVTGDGILDLVVGHAKEQAVALTGRGDGTFGAGTEVSLGAFCATRIALGDMNGDGALDIVATSGRGGVIVLGDGAGGWGEPKPAALGASARGLALADIDGDGHLDWLLSDIDRDRVEVLLNDASGRVEAMTPDVVAEFGLWSETLASGDINGDGRLDLVAEGFQRACVYLGDPGEPSGFRFGPVTPGVGLDVTIIRTGDFNGDGLDDIVLGAQTGYITDPDVRVFLSAASHPGGFEDMGVIRPGVQNHDFIAADFTGDGHLDLLVAGGPIDQAFVLLPGLGNGRFGPGRRHEAPGLVFAAALDMNGDGAVDLLVGDSRRHVVQVLINDGAGWFSPGSEFAAADPWRIAAGDLNGDGEPDIVSAGMTQMQVLLSDGSAMAAPKQFAVPARHWGLELRDMDGDGHLDIVLLVDPSLGKPGLLVFINDGAGDFEGPGLFWLGKLVRGLVAEDLDGDGDIDVAALSQADSGAPTATLRTLTSRMADGGCRADLTGDGRLDFFDFLAFQSAFSAGDLVADFTGDGVLDFFDFLAFQDEFAASCPAR